MTMGAVINPNNLKIEGFYCDDGESKEPKILLVQDIREIIAQGMVVNDTDALTDSEELVRLKKVLMINFQPIGKPVVTTEKEKLGKVNDYAADSQSLYIQKIYVTQTLLRSLGGSQLGIDRSQIVEITNKQIVVKPPLQLSKAPSALGVPAS